MKRLLLFILILECLAFESVHATGWVNVHDDCPNVVGDGITDDALAINSCIQNHQGAGIFFPKTQPNPKPSFYLRSPIHPMGSGMILKGESAGFSNNTHGLGGTVLQFAPGVTGIWLDNEVCPNCGVETLSLLGSETTADQTDPTKFIIPSNINLPIYNRAISLIQRRGGVLTVTVAPLGGAEGLTQQVGSTVRISGVSGDSTMNGLCTVTSLTPQTNPVTFSCGQIGVDSGPFTGSSGMTVGLPTTGVSAADGIRVCGNFSTIWRVVVQNFGRHGINLDFEPGVQQPIFR